MYEQLNNITENAENPMKSRQILKNNIMNIKLLKSRGSFKRTVTFIEHIESGEKRLGDGELWEYITQKSGLWVKMQATMYRKVR